MIRTRAEICPDMESSGHKLRRAGRVMRRKFDERCPTIRDVKAAYTWSGHWRLSRNGVAVTGEFEAGV